MTRATRTRLLLAAGRATAYAVVMALIAALWVRPPLLGWIGFAIVAHQLLSTVWNIALAAVLVAAAFGRSVGKRLVEDSSTRARELRAAPRA